MHRRNGQRVDAGSVLSQPTRYIPIPTIWLSHRPRRFGHVRTHLQRNRHGHDAIIMHARSRPCATIVSASQMFDIPPTAWNWRISAVPVVSAAPSSAIIAGREIAVVSQPACPRSS